MSIHLWDSGKKLNPKLFILATVNFEVSDYHFHVTPQSLRVHHVYQGLTAQFEVNNKIFRVSIYAFRSTYVSGPDRIESSRFFRYFSFSLRAPKNIRFLNTNSYWWPVYQFYVRKDLTIGQWWVKKPSDIPILHKCSFFCLVNHGFSVLYRRFPSVNVLNFLRMRSDLVYLCNYLPKNPS